MGAGKPECTPGAVAALTRSSVDMHSVKQATGGGVSHRSAVFTATLILDIWIGNETERPPRAFADT